MPDSSQQTLVAEPAEPFRSHAEMRQWLGVCSEAGVAVGRVPAYFVKSVVDAAAGRMTVGMLPSEPNGLQRPTVRAIEASSAVKDGARDILVAIPLPLVDPLDPLAMRSLVREVVRGVRAAEPSVVVGIAIPPATATPADVETLLTETVLSGADYLQLPFTTELRRDGVAVEMPLQGDDLSEHETIRCFVRSK